MQLVLGRFTYDFSLELCDFLSKKQCEFIVKMGTGFWLNSFDFHENTESCARFLMI